MDNRTANPVYTLTEASKALGISRQAIWERVKRGTIRRSKTKAGRFVLIDHDEIERIKREELK